MRFIQSALTTLAFKIIAMAAGLAVSVVIARVLGPEGRGVYALVMTIIVLSASFGVFGLTASNTYFAAKDGSMARTIGMQSLITGLIGAGLAILTIQFIKIIGPSAFRGLDDALLGLTCALIPLFLWGNLFAFAFLGRGRILAFNTFETGQRVIFFAFSFIFLWMFQNTLETFLAAVLSVLGLLVVLYIIYYFRNAAPGPFYESGYTAASIAYGIKSYVATMLTLAVMKSGVLFVNYFGGNDDAGFFAVAQQISELVIIIPTVVGTVLFGRVSKGDSYYLTPMVLRTITAVFLPVTLVMFLGSDWLIRFVFGTEFSSSITALKIMLPGAFLLGLEVIIAKDLAGRGYPWPAVLSWVPVLFINILGFVILIPKFGVNGAALSVSISFLVIFLVITAYYVRLSKSSLGELFLVRQEDVRILKSQLTSIISGTFSKPNKGKYSADSALADQNKTEMQSVGS